MNRKIQAGVAELKRPYDRLKQRQEARIRELKERDPTFLAAEEKLELVKRAVDERKRELGAKFDNLPESVEMRTEIDRLRKRSGELQSQIRELESEQIVNDDELATIGAQKKESDQLSREKDRALREKRDLYVSKGAADMVVKVGAAEKVLQEATEKALAPYGPEKLWLQGFGYQAYRGYYNTNYARYISDHVRAQVGGGEMREDVRFLSELSKTVASDDDWSTSVDWDWRMKQEVDGSVKDLPLLQKWIKRVRGPVVGVMSDQ